MIESSLESSMLSSKLVPSVQESQRSHRLRLDDRPSNIFHTANKHSALAHRCTFLFQYSSNTLDGDKNAKLSEMSVQRLDFDNFDVEFLEILLSTLFGNRNL